MMGRSEADEEARLLVELERRGVRGRIHLPGGLDGGCQTVDADAGAGEHRSDAIDAELAVDAVSPLIFSGEVDENDDGLFGRSIPFAPSLRVVQVFLEHVSYRPKLGSHADADA